MSPYIRTTLSDAQWARIAPHLSGMPGQPGATGRDSRRFIEAVLWILRTGAPWRDLPAALGAWNTTYRRFRRWALAGKWRQVWQQLAPSRAAHGRVAALDSTAVRVHQHGAPPAARRHDEAVGKSRAGWTSKVHMAVDVKCRMRACLLSPGHEADIAHAPELLARCGRPPLTVIADKAYDKDAFVAAIEQAGSSAVIPPRRSRRHPRHLCRRRYRIRQVVERHFARIKQFRRLATRYERTASSLMAMLMLAETILLV